MGQDDRSLEIEEDPTFQRHQMRFERTGWAILSVILIAALLGFLGGGLLGGATAGDAGDAIRLEYGRLERRSNPATVSVELAPEAVAGGEARLWVARAWADAVVVDSVSPEPELVEVDPDRLVYVFAVQPGAGTVEIVFHLRYERWGRLSGEIGLDGGPSHEFGQFVYP